MTTSPRLLHFLLVEDDVDHAYLVRRGMAKARIANVLDHVQDGVEALKYLEGEAPYQDRPWPDMILLDLKLPKMDGHEVLARIKSSPDLKTIPVIVLTTSDTESDRARADAHNANCYIVKPLEGEGFRTVVEHLGFYWAAVDAGPSATDPTDETV